MGIIIMKTMENIRKHIMTSLAFMSALLLPLLFQGGLLQPTEAAGATISCSSGVSGCHFKYTAKDGTGRNVPAGLFLGTHARHSGYSTGSKRQYQYACTKCHPSTGYTNSHQTGYKNITGSSLPGTSYSAGKKIQNTNTPTFGNCSQLYCHSNGRATGLGQKQYSSVRWGGTETCLGCHGGRSTVSPYNPARSVGNFTLSTSHSQHLKYPLANMNCQICHAKTATNATTLKNYTGVVRHVNGVSDVIFTDIAYASYTSYKTSGADVKKCNNTSCHGGKSRGAWSASAQNTDHTCSHCHGVSGTTVAAGNADKRLFAPGFRRLGTSTDQLVRSDNIRVGSHFKHLSSLYMKNIKCNECHKVPSTPFDAATNHTLNTLRFNSATLTFVQASTATITIGVADGSNPARLASFGGYTNGTAIKASTCSSTYCHGSRLKNGAAGGTYTKPYWNYSAMVNYTDKTNACARCHGNPPSSVSGSHNGKQATYSCSGCHATVVDANGNIINKTLHIDGRVQATGGHEYGFAGYKHMPGGVGTLTVTSNTDLSKCTGCHTGTSGGSYPATRGSAANIVCTVCHKNNANFFTTGSVGCGDCHGSDALLGRPNGAATVAAFPNWSGSHSAHASQGYVCDDCHLNKGSGHLGHGNYSGILKTRADVAIAFNTSLSGTSATYSSGTMACSTSNCHGQKSPAWGAVVPNPQCVRCHGYQSLATLNNYTQNSIAPGTGNIDTNRTTGITARGGVHQEHMGKGVGISAKVRCVACHASTTAVNHAVLDNRTTATVTFSDHATDMSHTPTVTRSSGIITCNNTYCHTGKNNTGANMAPAWNSGTYLSSTIDMASCKQCHNMPPATGDHSGISNLSAFPANTCNCHTNLNSGSGPTYANIFTDKNQHINGIIEYVSDCNGCHNQTQATTRRAVASSATTAYEFSITGRLTNLTSHVKTGNINPATCEICHAQSSHKTIVGGVNVLLWDTRAASGTGTITYNGTAASLDNFCIGCHRSGGFANIANMRPSASTATATAPYSDSSDSTAPRDIFSNWSVIVANRVTKDALMGNPAYNHQAIDCMSCHGNYMAAASESTTNPRANAHASVNGKFLRYSSTVAGKGEAATCLNRLTGCHGPNSTITRTASRVYSEFKTNATKGKGAHPVLGSIVPNSSNMVADTATGRLFVGGFKANSVVACSDCHGSATGNGPRGPHGSAYPYLLRGVDTTITKSTSGVTLGAPLYSTLTNTAGSNRAFCLNCHAADVYGDGDGKSGTAANNTLAGDALGHDGKGAAFGSNCGPASASKQGIGCTNCHCGAGQSGGSHSTSTTWVLGPGNSGFVNGNCWTAGPDATNGCYATASASGWSNCGQGTHDSSDRRFKKNFREILAPLQRLFTLRAGDFQHGGVNVLLESVKEQQRSIDAQQKELDELRKTLRDID